MTSKGLWGSRSPSQQARLDVIRERGLTRSPSPMLTPSGASTPAMLPEPRLMNPIGSRQASPQGMIEGSSHSLTVNPVGMLEISGSEKPKPSYVMPSGSSSSSESVSRSVSLHVIDEEPSKPVAAIMPNPAYKATAETAVVLGRSNVKWAPEFGAMTDYFKAGRKVYCDGKRERVPILDTDFWAKLYGFYFDIKQLGDTKLARREGGAKAIIERMRYISYHDANGVGYNRFPNATSLARSGRRKGNAEEYSNPENPVYPMYRLYKLIESKSYDVAGYLFKDE